MYKRQLVVSVVKWLVTRWALDGTTLRIETGLLRRDARQLPLARIQAVAVSYTHLYAAARTGASYSVGSPTRIAFNFDLFTWMRSL